MIRSETQALVDGFAAAGLLAYVAALLLRRSDGPLTPRLVFLFGLMAFFYGVRSLAVRTGFSVFEAATFVAAALAPLAALLLAEGLLRRHAPRPMKIAILVVSALGVGFALFTAGHVPFGSRAALAASVIVSLLAVLILLWSRDRRLLSAAENGAVRRLAIGLAVVIPLVATDFHGLTPAPIGFSPIAALVIAVLALSNGVNGTRDVWVEAGLIVAAACALTFGLIERLDVQSVDDQVRLFALVAAALITMTLVVRIQPFSAPGREGGLRRKLLQADTSSLDHFLNALAGDPMLKDLSIRGAADLDDYPAREMAVTLARRPLWSTAALQAADGATPAEREPLLDLLARSDATHVGLLSVSPLRIGLVRVPELLRETEAEEDLELAFRMARMTAETAS